MSIDTHSLARRIDQALTEYADRPRRRLVDHILSAVMAEDGVERETLPFVAVHRYPTREPNVHAAFRYAEDCRVWVEGRKGLSAETRDGRKLVQSFDNQGYAHGTRILDILEGHDR